MSCTGVVAPVRSCTLASVRVMSASVAEVNHLNPCSLYEPSVCGTATVSVPVAEDMKDSEKQLMKHYISYSCSVKSQSQKVKNFLHR